VYPELVPCVCFEQAGSSSWRFMTRDHGPAWSTCHAPAGPLQFRLVVTGGYDGKWVWAEGEVLPRRWEVGRVYDAGVQITACITKTKLATVLNLNTTLMHMH
jgi:hypothetical protein